MADLEDDLSSFREMPFFNLVGNLQKLNDYQCKQTNLSLKANWSLGLPNQYTICDTLLLDCKLIDI